MIIITLGVYEVQENSIFAVYPNPSAGTFTIDTKINEYELVITNMLGQIILNRKIENGEGTTIINLSPQPSGMYFIQEQCNNGTSAQKIIIIH